MQIQAKVTGEYQELVHQLKDRGITAKLVKGAVIVDLPCSGTAGVIYEKIPELQGRTVTFQIDLAEYGGGATNTGTAVVVCGITGCALMPYYVPLGGHLSNSVHAHFATNRPVITVRIDRPTYEIRIEKHEIQSRDASVELVTTPIWGGYSDDLPEMFECYRDAIDAATEKVNCYHCRHAHYILQKSNGN